MSERPYDVSDVVESLKQQLGDAAVRAALAEARLEQAVKQVGALNDRVEQLATELAEAKQPEPTVIEGEG